MGTHAVSGIWVIALVTAGSIRAVRENRAPPVRAAAMTSWLSYAESQRTVTCPVAPALRAVARASATRRGCTLGGVRRTTAQPGRGDHRRRQRRRAGREQHVQALDPRVPVPGALLLVPEGRLDGESRCPGRRPGRRRPAAAPARRGSPAPARPPRRAGARGANVNARKNVPNVDGARPAVKTRPMPP